MTRATAEEGDEVVGEEGVEGCGVGGVGRKRPHVVVAAKEVDEQRNAVHVAAEARPSVLKARCMHPLRCGWRCGNGECWLALKRETRQAVHLSVARKRRWRCSSRGRWMGGPLVVANGTHEGQRAQVS